MTCLDFKKILAQVNVSGPWENILTMWHSCNCYLNKTYLTLPYLKNLVSLTLNLPGAFLPSPVMGGGHLKTVKCCQNSGENILQLTFLVPNSLTMLTFNKISKLTY